jgi:nitroreductase
MPALTAMTLELDRRQLLRVAMSAAAAWQLQPWAVTAHADVAATAPGDGTATIEAFADTMIPGRKRNPADRAIAGAAAGPGAVQAGALDLMRFPAVGIGPGLPALAADLDARAVAYAAEAQLLLDPGVPPFVALDFHHRTRLAIELLDFGRPDYLPYYALAALAFLAFHTAGHLHTAEAVRRGHPGLALIGFPPPDADGLWRYPEFSYRRRVAARHRRTTRTGNPA